jgi:hypothetical protein
MATMAGQADVPPEDVAQGRAPLAYSATGPEAEAMRLVHIQCSKGRPSDAYVAVNYRNHWFWINDRDLNSKRAFAFMIMLFSLAETGERQSLKLITIPAQ